MLAHPLVKALRNEECAADVGLKSLCKAVTASAGEASTFFAAPALAPTTSWPPIRCERRRRDRRWRWHWWARGCTGCCRDGVLSRAVTERRREVGIRMALGAVRSRTVVTLARSAALRIGIGVGDRVGGAGGTADAVAAVRGYRGGPAGGVNDAGTADGSAGDGVRGTGGTSGVDPTDGGDSGGVSALPRP